MAESGVARPEDRGDDHIEPLFYPARKLDSGAPLRWLRLGWQDMRAAPGPSLAYGAALTLISYLLLYLAWDEGHTMSLFTLVTGLILLGPVLAFGLYSISRQLQLGLPPRLGYCWRESQTHLRNELLFALVLLVILLVWARAASMVHVFFPISEDLGLLGWLEFLAVGSAVGSIFAAIVFTASAFSLPMMLDRGTDAITGALTSVNAVLTNKGVMAIWAALILGLVLLGVLTAFLGLAVALPVIGHATWHGYKETIEAGAEAQPSDG
ncbi:MAG: DUF2189 domain-containing protein [Gammaproteobacteria bacterium]|jgi:uncharacterized membrane protein